MLNQLIGLKSDVEAIDTLLEILGELNLNGTVYVGYPVVELPDGAEAVDLLLLTREHGLVAVDIDRGGAGRGPEIVGRRQRILSQGLSQALAKSGRGAVAGRLFVEVQILTFDPEAVSTGPEVAEQVLGPVHDNSPAPAGSKYGGRPRPSQPAAPAPRPEASRHVPDVAGPSLFVQRLRRFPPVDAAALRLTTGAIQRVASTQAVTGRARIGALSGVRAEILASISARISQLDQWQVAAAVEMPDGPQRIRGLAGTGKTVVLAYKAAYLHFQEPTFQIAITFYNPTLQGYIRRMVERFYRDLTGGKVPDWNRLHIRHAWGGRSRAGIYSSICSHLGIEFIPLEPVMNSRRSGRTG